MSDIAIEAKNFVAYIRDAGLVEGMPTEFHALADAVDADKEVPYDVLYCGLRQTCDCPRCGKSERIPVPMKASVFVHWVKYFRYKHQYCKGML